MMHGEIRITGNGHTRKLLWEGMGYAHVETNELKWNFVGLSM